MADREAEFSAADSGPAGPKSRTSAAPRPLPESRPLEGKGAGQDRFAAALKDAGSPD